MIDNEKILIENESESETIINCIDNNFTPVNIIFYNKIGILVVNLDLTNITIITETIDINKEKSININYILVSFKSEDGVLYIKIGLLLKFSIFLNKSMIFKFKETKIYKDKHKLIFRFITNNDLKLQNEKFSLLTNESDIFKCFKHFSNQTINKFENFSCRYDYNYKILVHAV